MTETSETPEVPEEEAVEAEAVTDSTEYEEAATAVEEATEAEVVSAEVEPAEATEESLPKEEVVAAKEESEDLPAADNSAMSLDGLAAGAGEPEVLIDPIGRLENPAEGTFLWGTGRRKNARARVRIRPGDGDFTVNGKPMRDYFPRSMDQNQVLGPLRTLSVQKKVDVWVNAEGGGFTGQAGAVRMGLGRALMTLYPDSHDVLREEGHLTRDPRMVERKKFGRHGARRGHQWGKR